MADAGTHAELMARRGLYHRLMAAQATGAPPAADQIPGLESGAVDGERADARDDGRREGAGAVDIVPSRDLGWARVISHPARDGAAVPGAARPDLRPGRRPRGRADRGGRALGPGGARGEAGPALGRVARRPAGGGPGSGRPPLAGVMARPRSRLPAPRRHAPGLLPQARCPRPRVPDAPAVGRSGRRGHPRHRVHRVLLRSYRDPGGGGGAGADGGAGRPHRARLVAGRGRAALPAVCRAVAGGGPAAHRPAGVAGARGVGRAQRARRRRRAGAGRAGRVPARARRGARPSRRGRASTSGRACRSCATSRGRAHCRRWRPGSPASPSSRPAPRW